jgi:hypothetical protein
VYGPVAAGGGEIRPIGHVRYVSEGGESAGALRFLVETLSGPVNAALLAVGALVAVAAVVAYERYRPAATDLWVLRETFRSVDVDTYNRGTAYVATARKAWSADWTGGFSATVVRPARSAPTASSCSAFRRSIPDGGTSSAS